MFTVDDIPNNERISDRVEVTLVEISSSNNSKVDYELTVKDDEGNTVPMKIWATHDIEALWNESHRYEFTNARGKVWTKNGRRFARLSSTKDLEVTDLGPTTGDGTQVLVVGDTHVGYANRPRKNRVPQRRNVNCKAAFREAVENAIDQDVDAFVHAGDVFDDETNAGELLVVTQAINQLDDAGIPFYYIFGNHESDAGMTLLNGVDSAYHLSTVPTSIGNTNVNLFGIDYHSPTDFPNSPITTDVSPNDSSILIAHQTFAPFRPDGVDLQGLLRTSPVTFDAILSGHLHYGEEHTLGGIPVIYTGATERISKIGTPNNPSAWLLTVTGHRVSIGRQSLQ